jgi:hypothetical protein
MEVANGMSAAMPLLLLLDVAMLYAEGPQQS